jgi:catalase
VSNDATDLTRPHLPPLSGPALVARLAVVGAILAAVAATFAYLGGWLTPRAVTPAKFADVFEAVDGVHPGFRRNHAKGLCVSGHFDSSGAATRLSKAGVFRSGSVPVLGRFSRAGGQPYAPDASAFSSPSRTGSCGAPP